MKRKTDIAVSEAVSFIFQSGYFGRSEYAIPHETQLSIDEPESAFGNMDGFDDGLLVERMRTLPCYKDASQEEVMESVGRHTFHIPCGKSDATLAALSSVYELRQKYGIRKFILLTAGVADRERFWRTMSVMRDYFSDKYYGLKLDILTYSSEDLRQIRAFALSDDIELLIINKEYFIRPNNLIKRESDLLEGISPLQMLRPARCVLFTVSEDMKEVAAILRHTHLFNPLCTVSFTENASDLPGIPCIDPKLFLPQKNPPPEPVPEPDDCQIGI